MFSIICHKYLYWAEESRAEESQKKYRFGPRSPGPKWFWAEESRNRLQSSTSGTAKRYQVVSPGSGSTRSVSILVPHSAQPRMIPNRSPSSDAGYGIIRGVPSAWSLSQFGPGSARPGQLSLLLISNNGSITPSMYHHRNT